MRKNYALNIYYFSILCCVMILGTSCKKEISQLPEITVPIAPPVEDADKDGVIKFNGAVPALDSISQTYFVPVSEGQATLNPLIEISNQPNTIFINEQLVNNFQKHELLEFEGDKVHSLQVNYENNATENYNLIFTNLPIIQIHTHGQAILNEPKIAATFSLTDPNFLKNGQLLHKTISQIGIETRGLSSQKYEKKAYGIEFWKDAQGEETLDVSLLNMREDDDWILDAMYIDPARMRNRVTTNIWLDFQNLSYVDQEPMARNGTHGKFVEVFLNHAYQGVYTLTERIDRKLLDLKKFKSTNNYGLLYKAIGWGDPVRFRGYKDYDPNLYHWEGWEQEYPDPMEEGIYWEPLADFVKFVVDASDEEFRDHIGTQLDLDNAIDYFILLNLIRADDNTGKNTFIAKYRQTDPFFFIPWDLDATWGLFWDGSRTSPNDHILSNGLFNRLLATNPDNFRQRLQHRWQTARKDIFSHPNLMAYFQDYETLLQRRNAFSREQEKWNLQANLSNEIMQIDEWLSKRLKYLDDYFEKIYVL